MTGLPSELVCVKHSLQILVHLQEKFPSDFKNFCKKYLDEVSGIFVQKISWKTN